MTWSQTSDVLRIVVARSDLERAQEALAAMNAGDTHPFRGPAPPPDDDEEKFVKSRSAFGAAMLAVLVPIGAGHFYARHGAGATILSAGIAVAVMAMVFGGVRGMAIVWALLVVFDVVGSFGAVRRYNENRVPSDRVQRGWAFGALALAFVLAWFIDGAR